jgi:hypothetical protein
MGESAKKFLDWIVEKTNSVMELSKNGLFFIVVSTIIVKFIKTPPKERDYYLNSFIEPNRIGNSSTYSQVFNTNRRFDDQRERPNIIQDPNNQNIFWIPVRMDNNNLNNPGNNNPILTIQNGNI